MKISILIAAYRAGPFLRTALASVAKQTHEDWELVVVEDGSHDETEAIVRAFGFARPTRSIRYENHGKNRGVAATRNRLLALAGGDAVAFLDADDWWSPDHLAEGVRQLESGAELVATGVHCFDLETGRDLGDVRPPASLVTDPVESLFAESVIITSSCVLLSRGVVARTGEFDPNFSVGEDRDYWLRAAIADARFGISTALTCHYAKHARSTMAQTQLVAAQAVRFYEKHFTLALIPLERRRRQLAHHLINEGRLLRHEHARESVRQLWRAWHLTPFNLKTTAHLVFSSATAMLRRPSPTPPSVPSAGSRAGFSRPPGGEATPAPLSVCIPAYNSERYLTETLESIRAQTYTHWELIVVEDGTHDQTEQIVARFAQQGPQPVTFRRNPVNLGLPATRNAAISLARGKWIVLMDHDDLWTPDHLTSLLACAQEHPTANLLHGGSVLFDSDSERELEVRAPSPAQVHDFPLSLFLGGYCIQPSSVMFRKSLWTLVGGFDPAFRYSDDREMWMRCAQAGATFAFTGRNTCLYRKHANALSTHAAPMALACALIFDKAADWKSIPLHLRRQHAAEGWVSAGRLVLRRDPHRAGDYFAKARRYRLTPRILAYSVVAFGLGLFHSRRPSPVVPTKTGTRPPVTSRN